VNAENGTNHDSPIRVLFVCLANLCRSPMAVVIARALHDGVIEADSAGVAPAEGPVFPVMAAVVRDLYGADVTGHRARHVLDYPVSDYDVIIAMDSSIFMRLSGMPEIPRDRLRGWEIPDPAGLGRDAYEGTAALIEENLDRFLDRIGAEA
jgi:protein-tyrosine-phosphatase